MKEAAIWERIDALQPWKDNPRKNKGAINHVAESIRRFGFASPIIARSDDKVIIAGHTRFEAAKKLGLDSVPVRYLDLDPAEPGLWALADNKIGEIAEWDEEKLEKVMQELLDEGLSLDGIGWSDDELNKIVDELKQEEIEEDEVPEADEEGEPDSKHGEVYELGEHILVCGDWREKTLRQSAFSKLHPEAGIHDPPYGISVVKNGSIRGSGSIGGSGIVKANKYKPIYEDDQPFDPTELLEIIPNSILWGANYYSSKLKDTKGWIVWDKKEKDWDDNFSDAELAWTVNDCPLKIYRYMWMGALKKGNRKLEGKRVHPTQKPIGLIAQIINDYFSKHNVIADFYLGSGTTLIACAHIKKKCIGFEIERSYCDVIRRRWTQYAKDHDLEVGTGGLE